MKENIGITVINRACKFLLVYTNGRHYTCSMKEKKGDTSFIFKGEWHKVDDYIDVNTREVIRGKDGLESRIYKSEK